MLDWLKQTQFGKMLYAGTRLPLVGPVITTAVKLVQAEAIQPAHYKPAHRKHNAKQQAILQRFERGEL